jgi:hypothetical protein
MSPVESLRLMRRLGIGHSLATRRHRERARKGYYVKRVPISAPTLVEPFW